MKDEIRFLFECMVDALFEGVVDVEFSLVDTFFSDFSVGGIAEMSISEVI